MRNIKVISLLLVLLHCNTATVQAQCPYITASPSMPICAGSPVTFTLQDLPALAVVTSWETSTSANFVNPIATAVGNNQTTITFDAGFTQNTYIRANILVNGIEISSLGCANPSLPIVVEQPVTLNEIQTPEAVIDCDTELPLEITGNQLASSTVFANYIWQISYNQSDWQTIASGTDPNLSIIQLPQEAIYVRRIIDPVSCAVSVSNVLFIDISGLSNGGMVVGGNYYCDGETPGQLQLLDHVGEVIQWEQSVNGGSYSVVNNSAGITGIAPASSPGQYAYRALVQNGNCNAVYSAVDSVIVNEEIINDIFSANQEVCSDQIPEAITGNDPTAIDPSASVLWQSKLVSEDNWQNNPDEAEITITSVTFDTPLSASTMFRRVVSYGADCESFSNIVTIVVNPAGEPGSFTNTETTQVLCPGETPAALEITGYSGDIMHWEMGPAPTGPWSIINDEESIFQPGPPDADTYYRVLVETDECGPVYSEVYSILVNAVISNNSISDDQSICPGEQPEPLEGTFPEGATGTYTLLWQQKTIATDWQDAPGTNNALNYTPEGIDEATWFRRIVASGNCDMDTSNVVLIDFHENPYGVFTGGGFYCPGEPLEILIELTGTPPFVIAFDDGEESFTLDGINSNSYVITVTTDQPTTYTLTGVSDAFCTSDPDMATTSVEVIPVPAIGPVSAGNDTSICGLSYTLTGSPLSDAQNQVCAWTDSQGNVLANTPEFEFVADEPGLFEFIYTITSEVCTTSISDTVFIALDVFEPAVTNGDQQICANSTQLSAQPIVFGVGHWYVPSALVLSDPFDPSATLSGLSHGSTYNVAWITESLSGVCPQDTSWMQISVDDLSVSGSLTATSTTVCSGTPVTLTLNGQTGVVNQWMFEDGSGLNSIASDATQFSADNLQDSTSISVVVQSGTCPPDTSDAINISVFPQTIPGELIGGTTVCSGENSGTLELSGNNGEIIHWERSIDGFQSFDIIENASPSYSYLNLDTTTSFRALVQSGICEALYSSTATIVVNEQVLATFALDEEYCADTEAFSLSTLIEEDVEGTWSINGLENVTFDPSIYAGSNVVVSFTSSGTCGNTSNASTFVWTVPEVTINAPEETCGLMAEIQAETSIGQGYWTTSENIVLGGSPSEGEIEIVSLAYGPEQLIWTASNGTCTSSQDHTITFHASPSEADAGPDQTLEFTSSTVLQANTPNVGVGTWASDDEGLSFEDPSNPATTVRNLKPGRNVLQWTITNGSCPANSSEVVINVGALTIPNAFSPNGDNVNDFYEILGLDAIAPVELTVWNTWGNEVYESTDYQNDWGGLHKNGNVLQSGTYYYLLKARGIDQVFKGFIVLKR